MIPTTMELFDNAWHRCDDLDGNLAEIHTEDELEMAREALKPHTSNKGFDSVWIGAVKNSTSKEDSYYWNSSLTEVDFDILKLSNKSSPCTWSECTLILRSDGKVRQTGINSWTMATALCELRAFNGSKNGYQIFKEQLEKEAQVRNKSMNALVVQMKKETEKVKEETMNALDVQIKDETRKVREETMNALDDHMKKEAQVREDSIKVLEAQIEKEVQARSESINGLETQMKKETEKVKEETIKALEAQIEKEVQARSESINGLETQMKKETEKVKEETIKALEAQMKKHMSNDESSESNVTSLKKSKSALFVLYSLNLIALLALGVFMFIIWRKVN